MGNTFKGGKDRSHKKAKILVGSGINDPDCFSFQCFERRHGQCGGTLFMMPGKCECDCHEEKGDWLYKSDKTDT